MTEYVLPVYSEQKLSPRAAEVIRAIANQHFPEHDIQFVSWNQSFHAKVLVFGSTGPAYTFKGVEYVYTYSIAQVMSKANAGTVVAAAIRQMIGQPEFDSVIYYPQRVDSVYQLENLLDPSKPTAIDIETDGDLKAVGPEGVNLISIAFYQEGLTPIVFAYADGEQTGVIGGYQLDLLGRFLLKFDKAVYWNGKFDVRVLNRVCGVKLKVWFDAMLAHHVLNIAAGDHKLKPTARRLLGAPEWERDLGKYTVGGGHYERIPVEVLTEYNGWDVYWTFQLFKLFKPQIEGDSNNESAFMLEMNAAEFLLDVEIAGIPLDRRYIQQYSANLLADMGDVLRDLHLAAGTELNPSSPKQVKDWFATVGVNLKKTDEATLQEIIDTFPVGTSEWKVATMILEYRGLAKIRGTYCEGWLSRADSNDRVHPTFLVHGTSTGRLSSTGPNAQNVPRDKTIRKIVRVHG